MPKFAIVCGTSLLNHPRLKSLKPTQVKTLHGEALVLKGKGCLFLPRHGLGKGYRHVLPHEINHPANLAALAECGVERVVALSSVGSLKRSLTPRHFVVPDDYLSLWRIATSVSGRPIHVTPGLDPELRQFLVQLLRQHRLPHADHGVYAETPGPRFETPAEIRLLKQFADVVGMTMASEATIARETGLRYACLCSVDNYANGLVKTPVDLDDLYATAQAKHGLMDTLLNDILEAQA